MEPFISKSSGSPSIIGLLKFADVRRGIRNISTVGDTGYTDPFQSWLFWLDEGFASPLSQKQVFISGFYTGKMARGLKVLASGLSILRTRKSVEESLDEAFASREPVFLDVVTESLLTELPPVYSWQKAAERKSWQ